MKTREDRLGKIWRNYSISTNTLKTDDLICAIQKFLNEKGYYYDPIEEDDDQEYYLHEYLMDYMNQLAPEGYYFGTHPGDGADIGFWKQEDT